MGMALAGSLAGCGGGGRGPSAAADQATARAINLTTGDLPAGFLAGAPSDPPAGPAPAKLAHCAGAPSPDQVDVVSLASPTFTAAVGPAQEQFSSEVTMVRSSGEAEAEIAALDRPSATTCLRTELGDQLRSALPAGSSLGTIGVTRFSPGGEPAQAIGVHLRIPVSATTSGATAQVVVTADLVELAVGRAVISLYARTTGSNSLAAEESHLDSVLSARARRTHQ